MALDYNSLAAPATTTTPKSEMSKPGEQAERKPLEKKVKGSVKVREKNPIQKMAGSFFEEDLSNVKTYVVQDVIIPLIKDAIADTFIGALEMLLYGSSSGRIRGRRNRNGNGQQQGQASYVAYNRFSDGSSGSGLRSRNRTSSQDAYDYNSLIFDNRGDAEAVLADLRAALEQYHQATVADLYDLVGQTGAFTDQKFGWKNLDEAHVKRVRDGYLIVLPRALSLVN